MHITSLPAAPTVAPGARPHRLKPLTLALAVALGMTAASPALPNITWTGNAPVYTASWYNGVYTEFHEFQYFLDWQGYCNAHIGASCASATFWGVPFNWDLNRLPTATDDVHTPAGSVVAISSYNSVYKGPIPGTAVAGSLTAEGQIRLGLGGLLSTDNAYIADLFLGGGTLETNGLVNVGNLSQTLGTLRGSGTTRVMSISSPLFSQTLIEAGHTLEFYGQYGGAFGGAFGSTGPLLEAGTGNVFTPGIPGARLINYGTLDGANVILEGSANFATLPRLINRGSLTGGLNADAVRVDNEGTVTLGAGGAMYFGPAGTHTGSFTAGLNSVLTFGGPWGHEFLPGSSLSSAGKVVFADGVHKVRGGFDAFETELQGGGGNAYLDFSGNSVHIDTLRVNAGSGELRFLTSAGVNLPELALNSGNVIFDTGAPGAKELSTIQALAMTGGTLTANSPVDLISPFQWNAGNLSGSGGVTALGGIEINTTAALNRGLYGLLRNPGTANWYGGVLNWGGTFENLAGASFNIRGDFSAGGGGLGRFVNAGNVYKTAGSGVANLGMAFDNSGLVQAQAGTLRLSGGGTHDGGRFEALPGALIELSGGTVLKGNITTLGRVDITGGSLSLGGGVSFTNLAGNGVSVSDLNIAAGASFTNHGSLGVAGTLDNAGTFTQHHPAAALGALTNSGSLANLGNLSVLGDVHNSGALNNMGGLAIGGGLMSSGSFRNDGAGSTTSVSGGPSLISGNFVNEGSLAFLGDVQFSGTGSNLGQIYNGGGTFSVLAGTGFYNQGSLIQDGDMFHVLSGAAVTGPGTYTQSFGTTWVQGLLAAGGGIDIQSGLLKGSGTIEGPVTLGQYARWAPGDSPGTMTVNGNVTLDGYAYLSPGGGNLEIEFDSPTVHDRIVVSGTLTLHEASIDLVFAPGFAALDGDSFEWLSAGQVLLPNGTGALTFNVSGLSADWQATPTFGAKGVGLEMIDLAATPIPISGNLRIEAGERAYNDGWATPDDLAVAGNLSNRVGGQIWTGPLTIEAGGRLLNRGILNAQEVANAGLLINRADGEFWHGGTFTNTGSLVNEGNFRSGDRFTNHGSVVNSGQFEIGFSGFTNAAGGRFTNTGVFTHAGQFVNEAGGRVDNRGTITADGQIVNRGEFVVVAGELQNNAWSPGPAYYTGSILNHQGGVFTVEAGGSVNGSGTYFQSHPDSVTRVNGTLAASDITLLQGVLTGSGTLVGPVTLGNASGFGATVAPGNSPGTLTVDGDLTAHHTTFEIELAGPALFDRLVVNGNAAFLGGKVSFLLHTPNGIDYDYRPAPGDSFTWLTVGGAATGLDSLGWDLVVVGEGWTSTVASSDWGSSQWIWGPTQSDGVNIAFYGDRIEFSAAPVPEPESYAMLLAGLGVVGWMARRRRMA